MIPCNPAQGVNHERVFVDLSSLVCFSQLCVVHLESVICVLGGG